MNNTKQGFDSERNSNTNLPSIIPNVKINLTNKVNDKQELTTGFNFYNPLVNNKKNVINTNDNYNNGNQTTNASTISNLTPKMTSLKSSDKFNNFSSSAKILDNINNKKDFKDKEKLKSNQLLFGVSKTKTFVVAPGSKIMQDTNPHYYRMLKDQFENANDYLNEDLDNILIIGKKSNNKKFSQVIKEEEEKQYFKKNQPMNKSGRKPSSKLTRTIKSSNTKLVDHSNQKNTISNMLKGSYSRDNSSNTSLIDSKQNRNFSKQRDHSNSISIKPGVNNILKTNSKNINVRAINNQRIKQDDNFYFIDDKQINEYFKEVQEIKEIQTSKKFKLNTAFKDEQFSKNFFALNKEELKSLFETQEKNLKQIEKTEEIYSKLCRKIGNKCNKQENQLLMSNSCDRYRVKKEMTEIHEEQVKDMKMARVQDWVISLRKTPSYKIVNTNSFVFSKKSKSVAMKNKEKQVMKYSSPIKELKEENEKEIIPNHPEQTTFNGKIIDSANVFNESIFERKMIVNVGTDNYPAWASVKESNVKKFEKIIKPFDGTDTQSHFRRTLNNLNNTNYTKFLQTNYFSTGNNTQYTNFKSTKGDFKTLPNINLLNNQMKTEIESQLVEKNNIDIQNISTKSKEINYNLTDSPKREFLITDSSTQKTKRNKDKRILNRLEEALYTGEVQNNKIQIDNIKVKDNFINELNWNKNTSTYSKLISKEEEVNCKLNQLILKGSDLASIEKDWALKIPGKKILFKPSHKGNYDEEIILSSFDKIIVKKNKEPELIN